MNKESNPRPVNWRKYIWVGLILLVAGYTYGRPTLEKWTGMELPSLTEDESRDVGAANRDPANPARELDRSKVLPPGSPSAATVDSGPPRIGVAEANKFELKQIGKDRFESPAGLVYTMGPGGEHRLDHVLRHGKDDPDRPVHSVFSGDRDTILSVIDEAFALIDSQPKRVKSTREGNRTEYTIDMQKEIGYEGGQKGKRQGFPALKQLKLVLQNRTNVVTAYPCR
jgi:hypothetical protein